MFGLSFEKIVLIGIIAAIVIGPSRLPAYAQKLDEVVRLLRAQLEIARDRASESVGIEDWQALDPRQYDPRRIVREALVVPNPSVNTHAPSAQTQSSTASAQPTSESNTETTIAEAAGSYVVTGSSGHPRKRFVARTTDGHAGDEESAAVHSGTVARSRRGVPSGAAVHSASGDDRGRAASVISP